jgi:hypothetical protein
VGYDVRDPRDPRDPRLRTPPDSGWARPEDYDVTEYRETGYGSDRYPPHDGGDPDSGGTVYRGSTPHPGDPESPADPGPDTSYDPTASIRGRVWRPTRGPRAEGANQGYGAPERGWRTSDGGYRSPEGGWHAPYRPYDTGEWRREQGADSGPPSSGEIVRYTPPVSGQPPGYRAGPTDVAGNPQWTDRSPEPPHTGEIMRYSDAGDPPDYPPGGYPASGYPANGYPANGYPGRSGGTGEIVPYRPGPPQPPGYPDAAGDAGRRRQGPGATGEVAGYPGAASPHSTGEIARYGVTPDPRGTEVPRYPVAEGTGRGRSDTDGRGRFDTNGRGRSDTNGRGRSDTDGRGRFGTDGRGWRADGGRFDTDGRGRRMDGGRPPASGGPMSGAPGGPGAGRRPASGTGETAPIPRQRPTSPASYQPPAPKRRALESGRRDDSPELYSHDPLTLGGGESPAMRYDRATQSYVYDAAPTEPPIPPSGLPDPRSAPRGPADPRMADPRMADPRMADPRMADPRMADPRAIDPRAADFRTAGYAARAIEAREYGNRGPDGRAADGGGYGGPRYQREPAPGPREEMPPRRPVDRGYDQPPVRRAPGRPQQRFEGTYPSRSVRNPRNVVPLHGRPGLDSDEDEEDAPGFLHTALVTTAWYTIPLLLYTMYVLTLDGSAQAGDGQSPRQNALNGLLGGMPRVGVALVTSLAVALLIRAISRGWRAATIGFASAVVGGGAATVIFAALTG